MTDQGETEEPAARDRAEAMRRRGAAGATVALDAASYRALDDETRERLAAERAASFAATHRIDPAAARAAGAPVLPEIAFAAVFAAMAGAVDPPLLAAAARVLSVAATHPDDAVVFGMFEAGSAAAFDVAAGRRAALPGGGAAQVGPLHRDLSSPCAVSPEFAARVVRRYRALTRRTVVLERVFTHHAASLCAAVAAAPADPAGVWALSDFLAALSRFRDDSLAQAAGAYRTAEAVRGRALARILNPPDG